MTGRIWKAGAAFAAASTALALTLVGSTGCVEIDGDKARDIPCL